MPRSLRAADSLCDVTRAFFSDLLVLAKNSAKMEKEKEAKDEQTHGEIVDVPGRVIVANAAKMEFFSRFESEFEREICSKSGSRFTQTDMQLWLFVR